MKVYILYLFSNLFFLTLGRICSDINFSSNSSKVKDDMVKNGVTSPKWLESTSTPIIIGPSKHIDYIYVIIDNHLDDQINITNFKLKYDDHVYANSTLKLDISHPTSHQTEYAVEINYLCMEYGGSLISYSLSIDLPDCGISEVHWKKLCGNPLLARDGFSIDLQFNNMNETIVRNGKIVNASYFDRDIENFVFTVPDTINSTTFYIYMDNASLITNETDPVLKALREAIRIVPETKYSKIKVDADESLVTPILSGSDLDGGFFTTKKFPITLNFKCLGRRGNSLVEFTIPLDYFKDIVIFFVKSCDGVEDFANPHHSIAKSVLFWVILILIFGCVFGSCYKIFIQNKKGLDAVPGLERSIKLGLMIKFVRESRFGNKLNEINQIHFNALKGNSEPEESEFKIENLSEIKDQKEKNTKYGSI